MKFNILLPLLILHTLFAGYTVVEDKSTLSVLTPSLAQRQTKKLKLDNGLEIYLISDPGTHQSAAALAVEMGSFDDSETRPGIAHFIEHMLFMGTEKYPEEEEYHSFLNTHGGLCNAFTTDDRTVYSFTCTNDHFQEALDRFAHLFISPLFRTSSLQREAQAIDQEFCKDLPLDAWRVLFVKKELANPNHPFHRFCIGNKKTLGNTTSEELKSWYETHYSAHLMHVAIYSSEPMETLEKSVSELFAQVKKREVSGAICKAELFLEETPKSIVTIAPLQELKTLELFWELPEAIANDKESHTDDLIAFVLGHEGEKSLFADLKKENWAESLGCSSERIGRDKQLFSISIKLTNQGVSDYEKVLKRTFEGISTFSKMGIPQYVYDEIKEMKKTRYAYQSRKEPFDFVTELAYALVDEPLETFPDKTLLPHNYDEKKIQAFFSCLTPNNCHIAFIVDPSLINCKATKKEKWMGTEYALLPLSEKHLKLWKELPPQHLFALPRRNPFLPEKLHIASDRVLENKTTLPLPERISESEKGTFYFAADDRFLTPEVGWVFTFKTPLVHADDPKSLVIADLYCRAIEKRLNSYAYEAHLAGLSYTLSSKENGFLLKIDGYSEKAFTLLKTILDEMTHFSPNKEEFAAAIEYYKMDYKNRLNKTPLSQGLDLLGNVLYKNPATVSSREKELHNITFGEFVHFSDELFDAGFVEAMMYGNMQKEEAVLVSSFIEENGFQNGYPPSSHFKKALASLPEEKGPFYIQKKSALHSNALILLLDCGPYTFEKKAALDILTTGLHEPFFSELRTKQQTAYLVQNASQEIEDHLYSLFLTQSSTHDTRDLMARFELFIENTLQNTEEVIPKTRFEAIRASSIIALEHPEEQVKGMSEILHKIAFEHKADFSRLNKQIEAMKTLSFEKFNEIAKQFLGKQNSKRLAICINGKLPSQTISYRKITSLDKVRGEITYEEKK